MPKKDKKVFKFVEEIPEDLLCAHCHGVLQNAVRLRDCEHAICEGCIAKRRKNDLIHCPCSEKLIEGNFEDSVKIRDLVGELLVYCQRNCDEILQLHELDNHLDILCVMKKVLCPNNGCTIKRRRKDMDDHARTWIFGSCPVMDATRS